MKIAIAPYLSAAAVIACATPSPAASGAASDRGVVRYVTDGDTFRLESGERIRIAGIDAPETHDDQAHCRAELRLGSGATEKARAVLEGRTVGIVRVGRSYNRTVARVTLEGRDIGQMFIDLGIAKPWPRGRPKPDWCAGSPIRRHR